MDENMIQNGGAPVPPSNNVPETPANAQYQAPVNAQYQPPVNTQYQAPANAQYQPPVNTQYQAPANAYYQAPTNTQYQAPANYYQAPASAPASPNPAPSPTPPAPQPPKKKISVGTIVGICIAVVAVAAAVIVLLGSGGNKGGGLLHSHSYGEWKVTKEATCLVDGEQVRTCSCGEKETETIVANGTHTFSDWVVNSATCMDDGMQTRICSVCGESETEVIKAAGSHSFTNWTITNATCERTGSKVRTCTACGEKESISIPATGHKEVTDAGTPATCISTGLTDGSHCSVCSTVIKAQTTIPMGAHSYSHGTCSVCGDISDAHAALAYYIYQNGTLYNNGDGYYLYDYWYDDGYKYSVFVSTNLSGTTLEFAMLTTKSGSSDVYTSMDVVKSASTQEVSMLYGSSYYCSGKIYPGTYNTSTSLIYSFTSNSSYLSSSLKELLAAETNLMLLLSSYIIEDTGLGIDMADLGFSNF